jgi:hypothetical protein
MLIRNIQRCVNLVAHKGRGGVSFFTVDFEFAGVNRRTLPLSPCGRGRFALASEGELRRTG